MKPDEELKKHFPPFVFLLIGFAIVLILVPHALFAHGFGQSLEKVVGQHLIDVGYNVLTLTASEPVRFDFSLLDAEERTDISFKNIRIRV